MSIRSSVWSVFNQTPIDARIFIVMADARLEYCQLERHNPPKQHDRKAFKACILGRVVGLER